LVLPSFYNLISNFSFFSHLFLQNPLIIQFNYIFSFICIFGKLYIPLIVNEIINSPFINDFPPIISIVLNPIKLYFILYIIFEPYTSLTLTDIYNLLPFDHGILNIIRLGILPLILYPYIPILFPPISFYYIFYLSPASIFIIKVNLVLFLFLTVRAALHDIVMINL